MEILVWAFIGGIIGALLMDVTETLAAKFGITSGVNIALVGRWFLEAKAKPKGSVSHFL